MRRERKIELLSLPMDMNWMREYCNLYRSIPYSLRFTYSTADELENSDLWGAMATYGGGGYVQELSETNKNESMDSIAFLKVR